MKPWTIADIQSRLNTLDQVDSDDPREKTRQRIMDVASEHFVRFGFRRARIGDIARDSVVGKGTPYLYFTSKKVLLFACLSREKRTLIPALQVVFSLPPRAAA